MSGNIVTMVPITSAEIGVRLARREYANQTERRSLIVAYSHAVVQDARKRGEMLLQRVSARPTEERKP